MADRMLKAQHEPASVLITGAAGFIGSNFARSFSVRHGGSMVLLDALTYAGNMDNIRDLLPHPRVSFVHGDICDEELLGRTFAGEQIDTVVHFAAESHVDRSIHGPDEFIRTNVQGTHALLKTARRSWQERGVEGRFHHVSTDEVYGSIAEGDPPATEETRYAPNSPYAASKAAADHVVRAYCQTYGMDVVTTNCSNNFGPYQFPEKLVSLAIVRALEGEPIPVYGDGLQIRDWLYVSDHCDALEQVLRRGRTGETYNIAGTGELTNMQVLQLLCGTVDELVAADARVRERFPRCAPAQSRRTSELLTRVKDRPGHDRRYALDATRVRDELGVTPTVGLEGGMRTTVRWYAENEEWWRRVMDGSYRNWIAANYGPA